MIVCDICKQEGICGSFTFVKEPNGVDWKGEICIKCQILVIAFIRQIEVGK